MIQIDVLTIEDCPHRNPALDLARDVVVELNVDAEIREIEVRDAAHAADLAFLGSPSIRVDGVDIDPSARDRGSYGYCCRTYDGNGLPPRGLLVNALQTATT